MSYVTAKIKGLEPGEAAYKLDSGEYVAARAEIGRDPVNSAMHCKVRVRQVDKKGEPVTDAHGAPIQTEYAQFNMRQADIEAMGGAKEFVRASLKIALGEDDAIREVPDNIRATIEAAAVATPEFDMHSLEDE